MAEALKTFKEGEDILASETNANNQFLLSKLSDNAMQVQSYVEGEVATIKSNVSSVQATLQNNIDELTEKLSIYIVSTKKSGTNWCRIWSDGWKEQGGYVGAVTSSGHKITFLEPFEDANYTMTTCRGINRTDLNENIQWKNKTASNVVLYAQAGSLNCDWQACGY